MRSNRQTEQQTCRSVSRETTDRCQRRTALIVLCALGIAPAIIWFHSGFTIAGADFNGPFNIVHTFKSIWSGWLDNQGTQGSSTFASSSGGLLAQEVPYLFLLWLGKVVGFTAGIAELLVFGAIVVAPGLAMWAFLGRTELRVAGRFTGSIVYMFNPYVLILWHSGYAIELIAYGLAPLVLLLVDVALHESILPRWFWPSCAIVLLALAAPASNPPTIVGNILLPAIIVSIARARLVPRKVSNLIRARRTLAAIAIGVVVNIWWLLPTALGALTGSVATGFSNTFESQNPPELSIRVPWTDSILNFGNWGWRQGYLGKAYYPFEHDYHSWPMWLVAAFPLALAVVGVIQLLIRAQRGRYLQIGIPGAVLWAVGFVLALGYHGPFGGLYLWAYKHVPGFVAFRSPWEKFEALTVMGIALLSACGGDGIADRIASLKSTKGSVALRVSSRMRHTASTLGEVAIVGGLSVALVLPMFGGFGGMFSNASAGGSSNYYVREPTYVTEFAASLNKTHRCGVFFPQYAWTSYLAFSWYRGGLTDFDELFNCPILQPNSYPSNSGQKWADLLDEGIQAGVNPQELAETLGMFGVTDVVLASDYDYSFYRAGPTTEALRAYFEHQAVFKMKKFGLWVDYKVPDADLVDRLFAPGRIAWTPNLTTLMSSSPEDVFHAISTAIGEKGMIVSGSSQRLVGTASSLLTSVKVPALNAPCTFCVAQLTSGTVTHGKLHLRLEDVPLYWKPLTFGQSGNPNNPIPCGAVTWVYALNGLPPIVSASALSSLQGSGVTVDSNNALGDCIVQTREPVSSEWVRVEFSYRVLSGRPPQFAVGPNGSQVLIHGTLPYTSEWKNVSYVVSNAHIDAPISLFLYSESSANQVGSVEYRGIEISDLARAINGEGKDSVLDSKLVVSEVGTSQVPADVEQQGKSWLVRVKGKLTLVSPIAFDSGWELSLKPVGTAMPPIHTDHILADGYLNGWVISGNGQYVASLEYAPGRQIDLGLALAALALLGTLIASLTEGLRRRRTSADRANVPHLPQNNERPEEPAATK